MAEIERGIKIKRGRVYRLALDVIGFFDFLSLIFDKV